MRNILLFMFMLPCALGARAQESLAGRVYYNKNIMEKFINDALAEEDIDAKLQTLRDSAYIAAEQKKGSKLTAEDKAKVDAEVDKSMKMVEAVKKGMTTAITVEFKSETQMVLKADMKIDDDLMKAAGIPWAKRKLMKAAMAIMPAQKANYVREGNLIISTDGKEKDTLTLSNDGKTLSGMFRRKNTLQAHAD